MSVTAKKSRVLAIGGGVAVTLVLGVVVGRSLGTLRGEPASVAASTAASVATSEKDAWTGDERFKIPVTDTQPTQGPVDALVTVTEFCNMRGPACRRANAAMKVLLKEYDGKLRWAFRSRLDAEQSQESRRMHLVARDAFQQTGKFWEVHERFLAVPDETRLGDAEVSRILGELGMDFEAASKRISDGRYGGAIALDNIFSTTFGVRGELGLFVNGRPLLKPDTTTDLVGALKPLIEQEVTEAERLVTQGIAKAKVYKELIKDARWGVGEASLAAQRAKSASASEHR